MNARIGMLIMMVSNLVIWTLVAILFARCIH